MLLSNNNEEMVEKFVKELEIPYIAKAHKPSIAAYHKAEKILEENSERILVIGYQIFSDVLGAKRTGLKCILVDPISREKNIFVRLKRPVERLLKKMKPAKNSKEDMIKCLN